MPEQNNSNTQSTVMVWTVTVLVVLVLIFWMTGGFDMIFGDKEDAMLDVPATEEPASGLPDEGADAEEADRARARTGKSATPDAVDVQGEDYYPETEVPPSILGGSAALAARLKYPESAKRNNIEGRVIIRAYINEKGRVVHTEVAKGIDAACDQAARDAVMATKFLPGQIGAKTVKSIVTIPLHFKLNPDSDSDSPLDVQSIPPGTPGF